VRRSLTARLFVAVDPPEEVREALSAWARSALRGEGARVGAGASLRVLDPDLLHVTLCFLGNRPVDEIDLLGDRLAACGAPAGELSLGAPLWLPTRRPRALAVELHDDQDRLASLQATVVQAMREASDRQAGRHESSGRRRGRRFRPHITVARMRTVGALRERALEPTPSLSFVPSELILYRSWLAPDGASYEALASHAIG
jgi:2'-5' RNA ligase